MGGSGVERARDAISVHRAIVQVFQGQMEGKDPIFRARGERSRRAQRLEGRTEVDELVIVLAQWCLLLRLRTSRAEVIVGMDGPADCAGHVSTTMQSDLG